ncbi:MAG: hypothetical protein V7720_09155, partial [Halioglobus sp.]
SATVAPYQAAAGDYVNEVTLAASVLVGEQLVEMGDTDLNHHFGVPVAEPQGVHIEKAINAIDPLAPTTLEDADSAPGVWLVSDTNVVWTYLVSNTGTLELDVNSVSDNAGTLDVANDFSPEYISGDLDGDDLLDPNEIWLYSSEAVRPYAVVEGAYSNTVTVAATVLGEGEELQAQDNNHHFGTDSETGREGNTPGFWKNNAEQWDAIAWPHLSQDQLLFEPTQLLSTLFPALEGSQQGGLSLEDALDLNGGGEKALIRHAVAAVLNAAQPLIPYPLTLAEVLNSVNEALQAGDKKTIEALKDELVGFNELGSGIDQHGRRVDSLHATMMADGGAAVDLVDVQSLVDAAAVRLFASPGVTPDAHSVAALAALDYVVTDLPGAEIARLQGNTVYVDATAAGHGWYVDQSPLEDGEFTIASHELLDQEDLLSALVHEMGHAAGLSHDDADMVEFMAEVLAPGERTIEDMHTSLFDPATGTWTMARDDRDYSESFAYPTVDRGHTDRAMSLAEWLFDDSHDLDSMPTAEREAGGPRIDWGEGNELLDYLGANKTIH